MGSIWAIHLVAPFFTSSKRGIYKNGRIFPQSENHGTPKNEIFPILLFIRLCINRHNWGRPLHHTCCRHKQVWRWAPNPHSCDTLCIIGSLWASQLLLNTRWIRAPALCRALAGSYTSLPLSQPRLPRCCFRSQLEETWTACPNGTSTQRRCQRGGGGPQRQTRAFQSGAHCVDHPKG